MAISVYDLREWAVTSLTNVLYYSIKHSIESIAVCIVLFCIKVWYCMTVGLKKIIFNLCLIAQTKTFCNAYTTIQKFWVISVAVISVAVGSFHMLFF